MHKIRTLAAIIIIIKTAVTIIIVRIVTEIIRLTATIVTAVQEEILGYKSLVAVEGEEALIKSSGLLQTPLVPVTLQAVVAQPPPVMDILVPVAPIALPVLMVRGVPDIKAIQVPVIEAMPILLLAESTRDEAVFDVRLRGEILFNQYKNKITSVKNSALFAILHY